MQREQDPQKKVITFSLACLAVVMLFCAAIVIDHSRVSRVGSVTATIDHRVQWSLDEPAMGAHHVTLTGWALIPGETLLQFDTSLLLQDPAGSETIEIPTTLAERPELNEAYEDDTDYTQCGFLAKINRTRLTPGVNYRVILRYFNNDHQVYIDTGQTIGGGE